MRKLWKISLGFFVISVGFITSLFAMNSILTLFFIGTHSHYVSAHFIQQSDSVGTTALKLLILILSLFAFGAIETLVFMYVNVWGGRLAVRLTGRYVWWERLIRGLVAVQVQMISLGFIKLGNHVREANIGKRIVRF
ncbi:MAG: hypothetical protein ACYDBP_07265 [Leptospirales bacterium]